MAIRKLSGDILWKMLRYEVGYTEEQADLQAALGADFDDTRSAYGVGGYCYDFRKLAMAKLSDLDIMAVCERWPDPKTWARKHHYPSGDLPETWADYFKSLGGPIPTV